MKKLKAKAPFAMEHKPIPIKKEKELKLIYIEGQKNMTAAERFKARNEAIRKKQKNNI